MTARHVWAMGVDDEDNPTAMIWRCTRCPVWRTWEDHEGKRTEVYHSPTIARRGRPLPCR